MGQQKSITIKGFAKGSVREEVDGRKKTRGMEHKRDFVKRCGSGRGRRGTH
jgi:hypothetical protein